MFCLCRYFLYFFNAGAIGSSNITSFSASAMCSVDFAGKILLVGGVNLLGGGGSGIPWYDGLVVTKDAGTCVTGSCCVFVAEGWVRLCVTVETGDRKRDKICQAVSSSSFGFWRSSPNKSFAIGLKPLILDLTLYIHHTMNPKVASISSDTIRIISITFRCTLKGIFQC